MPDTNPNPDLYPFWAEPEDLKPLTDAEKRREWKTLFMDQVFGRKADLKLWRDGDGRVWLGWFRQCPDGLRIVVRALVQEGSRTLVAVPMRREATDAVEGVAWWRPVRSEGVYEAVVETHRLIVPPGVF